MPLLVTLNSSGVWEDSTVGASLHSPTTPNFWQKEIRLFSPFYLSFFGEKNKSTIVFALMRLDSLKRHSLRG